MSNADHIKQYQWKPGKSANPKGRPSKWTDDEYLMVWLACQNPFLSRKSIAERFGMSYDTVYRIQRAKYSKTNKLVREVLGVEPVPIATYARKGPWADPKQILGPGYTPQTCPERHELQRQLDFYKEGRSVPGLEKVERVNKVDTAIDQLRSRP